MKTSLIICVKDEETTLASVIRRSQKFVDEILVIDGHSNDKSKEIAKKLGCRVFLDNRKGKGAAVRLGIQKAKGDILVFIDADGSHETRDILKLTKLIWDDKADLVVASRGLGGSDELHGGFEKMIRLIGNAIITLIINYRFGARLTDSQNGFRAIKRKVALRLNLKENTFTIEQEMIIKALKLGFRVAEVPSHEYARKIGKSHINILFVTPRCIWCLMKNIF